MIQQEINLLRRLPAAPKAMLEYERIVLWCGILLSILLAQSLYDLWCNQSRSSALSVILKEKKREQAELDRLLTQYPSLNLTNLKASTDQLQQDLVAKEQIIHSLSKVLPLSKVFSALAEAKIRGLWLTSIYVNEPKRIIDLRGNAMSPLLVHNYIAVLEKQPIFTGSKFKMLEISEPTAGQAGSGSSLMFYVTSNPE